MRENKDLISLLYALYVNNQWDCMEEYFEVAYALLAFHGAKWRDLNEIIKERMDSIVGDGYLYSHMVVPNTKETRKIAERINNDPYLGRLTKYEDSEEAWKEEINANPNKFDTFLEISYTFIIFKQMQ